MSAPKLTWKGPQVRAEIARRCVKALTEYALLFKGEADSPEGNLPGQYFCPRGVLHKPFTRTRSRTARDGIDCTFTAHEDDAQIEDNKLGWLMVQV